VTPCPTELLLRDFVSKRLDPVEADPLEFHIEHCSSCCERMERLEGVSGLSDILMKSAVRLGVQSPGLMHAIQHLQMEVASQLDTPSAFRTGNTLSLSLPVLNPSDQAGSIGRIGNIEIRRVIARGGMGVVYEGLDPVLQRTVAVKVLSPHLLSDREAKERFLREAQAIATLDAEHVVRIHAIEQIEDVPYLVLQYVDGSSLADILRERHKLPVEEVVRIGIQVAKGLESAHAHGLVHRDIKPANILIERSTQQIRLTDFGLAKLIGGEPITNVGTLAGTPAFMSPEQAIGEQVDARSDLFSLGVLLYTAASGCMPFVGDSSFVVLNNICTQSPKRLSDCDPKIPIWFSTVVHRLLEKKPDLRYQTATEVVDALQQQCAVRAVRKSRWPIWSLVTAGVVLGFAIWLVVQSALNSKREHTTMQTILKSNELRIVGRAERWVTITDAIAAANDGDVIEVFGDGPHPSAKINVTDKRLTIKAAEGFNPVIVPEQAAPTTSGDWLSSSRNLTLEGLTIDWTGPSGGDPEISRDEAVVVVKESASLTMRNCRVFVSGGRSACLSAEGPILLESCHLVCPNSGGRCLLWKPTDTLTVSGTCFEGRNGVVLVGYESKQECPIQLTDCTFRCDSALMRLRKSATDETPISMITTRCIYDVNNLVTIFFLQGLPKMKTNSADTRSRIKLKFLWLDSASVYRNKMRYFTLWAPQHAQVPTEFDSLSKWLAIWMNTEHTSIEGDLTFDIRAGGAAGKRATRPILTAITNASGPIPTGLLDRP
jgi:serine/threonine protein kinase